MSRTSVSLLGKRYLAVALIVLSGIVAIIVVQRERVDTRPSAQALLLAAADVQREVTRMPAKLDRLNDDDEIALGNALAMHAAASLIPTQSDASRDMDVEAYLQTVGARVAAHARRKLPWTFHYIPSPAFVNAFALPGGHVFVGEGLLRLMRSEDALAAVLGHEVEHIDLRHCAERAQLEAQLRQLGALGDLVGLPAELFVAGYSKEQELEADRDGIVLAVQTGYSYTGFLQLLNALDDLEQAVTRSREKSNNPVQEAGQLSVGMLSGYFASHPPSSQRSEQVKAIALQRHWPTPSLQNLPNMANLEAKSLSYLLADLARRECHEHHGRFEQGNL